MDPLQKKKLQKDAVKQWLESLLKYGELRLSILLEITSYDFLRPIHNWFNLENMVSFHCTITRE